MPGSSFHEDLFTHHPPRIRLSRRQNRATRHQHGLVRAKDRAKHSAANLMPVIPHQELQTMQEQDESLKKVHDPLKSSQPTHPFIGRDGLLYRRWTPRSMGTRNTADEVDQLVLPKQCREQVMALAHSIPFGGHLGRKKIFRRISKHFYWPSMHRDIADKCRSCETCQRCRQHHIPRAPMVPLPVVTEPFSRVAMDIIYLAAALGTVMFSCCATTVLDTQKQYLYERQTQRLYSRRADNDFFTCWHTSREPHGSRNQLPVAIAEGTLPNAPHRGSTYNSIPSPDRRAGGTI